MDVLRDTSDRKSVIFRTVSVLNHTKETCLFCIRFLFVSFFNATAFFSTLVLWFNLMILIAVNN